MKASARFRDGVAAAARRIPAFRGKAALGVRITNALTDFTDAGACLRDVTLWDGARVRIDLRSRTDQWVFWTGAYERQWVRFLLGLLAPGWVVLDIGANVGYYSVSLGRRLGELGGMLHAFEPVPANFAALSHNLQANDLGRTVVAHEIALGETDGSTGMTREMDRGASTGNAVMMTGEVEAAPGTESTAIVRRLDSLSAELGLRRCDLIKVDIEGAEALFLRGAREFVRRHTPLIFGEFSPSWMPAVGGTYPEVLDLLVPLGYKEYWTKPRGGFSSPAGIRGAYQDVLFVPSRMREELGRRLKSAR